MRILVALLASVFLAPLVSPVSAQEDAYHESLRATLTAEYGLTGGDWVFSEVESTTLALSQPTGVSSRSIPASGDVPFSSVREFTVASPGANPWDRTVRFPTQATVAQGDALLLVVWIRHTAPAGDRAHIEPIFERTSSPYEKSLQTAVEFDGGVWQQLILPFEAVDDYSTGSARIQFNMAFKTQTLEIGGLALLNYGAAVSVGSLPEVRPAASYDGRDSAAAWRADAASRIETHRKANMEIRVRDAAGNVVADAPVSVRMKQHAFLFGTAVSASAWVENTRFRNELADISGKGPTFTVAVLENSLKWDAWEANWPTTMDRKLELIDWLLNQGIEVRGHNLVWPNWQYLPDDLEANQSNLSYISDRVTRRILDAAGHPSLKGRLRDWDVINEMAHVKDLQNLFAGTPGYTDGTELYTEWFELAAQADPEARLFVNEYGIVSDYGLIAESTRQEYERIIEGLIQDGAKLDGLGIQGHMKLPLTPMDSVYAVLERFSRFEIPLSITEYDLSNVDDDLAADYLRDFLTMVFSHPGVESFLMWGFWDGAHWFGDAPLFDESWQLKASGQAFRDLVFDEWWTEADVQTGADGIATVRGYKGTYEVTAVVNGQPVSQQLVLAGDATTEMTLTATNTDRSDPGSSFGLGAIYPNPASVRAQVPIALDSAGPVSLTVYDLLGRRVAFDNMGFLTPGEHTLELGLEGMTTGVYLAVLTAGGRSATRSLRVFR
ncbi:MAG: T9SS type A sorting domain-containing protein [Rhodothermales bacterium]|nr:T9SS type A sorting domain-containing protein [Rhodothermales bacterium]